MKPRFLAFPLKLVFTSSAVMAVLAPLSTSAADYIWKGTTDSTWTVGTNWLLGTTPTYGATLTTDRLVIGNGVNAGAVYNPPLGETTTFGSGRGIVIGSTTEGPANLTVTSGTLKINGPNTTGNEPIMANGVNASVLINGGHLDLSGHGHGFRLCNTGATAEQTSVLTISSGTFSSGTFDFMAGGAAGTSTVNLDGGALAVTRFLKTVAGTTSTLNLDGGTLRLRSTQTTSPNFTLPDLGGLTTTVEDGGVIVDTNSFDGALAEVLEHDATLGAGLDGGLTKNGAGTLVLSGANTFTGGLTVNAGTALATFSRVTLENDSAAGTGTITLADSFAELRLFGTTGRTIANPLVISNTGDEKSLIFTQAGTATISGPITINETNINHFRVRTDNSTLNLSGKISGVGGINRYAGGFVVELTNGTNDFTGGAKLTVGTLGFSTGTLGTTGTIIMDGGTLRWAAANDEDISSRLLMVNGKTATFNLSEQNTPSYDVANVTFASAIGSSTTAAVVKTGPGVLTFTQPSTYSGGTTVTQGTLEFPNGGLGTTGSVTMNGGILRWGTGNSQDISSRIVMVDAKTASFSTNGNDVTFATAIGSSTTASLTKTNTLGTLTLNGANTYSGSTTVGGGTLKLGNPTALGVFGPQTTTTIGTTIGSGATLDLNGTTDINEVITLSGTGVGDNGALVNNSGTPANTSNLIAGFTVPATGSGSGYSTAPAVAISGGGGTGAAATASLGVTTASFAVNVAGNRDYTVAPTVTIAGGGSGATATAVLSGGATGTVIGITVTSAGSGFTTAPTATISGGTSTGTTTTTFTGNATSFTVGGLTLTNAGTGYTSAPSVTFDGSPATVTTTFSAVILAANSSIGGSGNSTINGVVSESGGARALTKVGAGTVTLNGANTYSGETKVDAGTLAISTDDTLANAAAVRLADATFLNLGFAGTDTVDRLYIGGVEQASGTWGSLASSATNKTARITGSGILDVTNGAAAANDYAAWASSQVPPVTGGVNGDDDNDGVKNLIEYALVDGGERGVLSGNTITFTKRGGVYGSDVTYDIESSTLLTAGSWATLAKPPVIESAGSISYTFTPGSPVKNFARLKVVQVP